MNYIKKLKKYIQRKMYENMEECWDSYINADAFRIEVISREGREDFNPHDDYDVWELLTARADVERKLEKYFRKKRIINFIEPYLK